jgi:TRAP-type mannitol/chloroaromatic compound transport system permease large subunit
MVLGSILGGFATPTEAAGVGAAGALVLALINKQLNLQKLKDVMMSTTKVTSMVFLILIGASIFSLVFRGFGGEELIEELFGLKKSNSLLIPISILIIAISFFYFKLLKIRCLCLV